MAVSRTPLVDGDADGPPDDWDPEDPRVGDDAARLRAAWVFAVREMHFRKTGEVSSYEPKVNLDGGLCPLTRRAYKPVWGKLAADARQLGLDPVRLVESLFNSLVSGFTPLPQTLTNPDNVRRCRATETRSAGRVASALATEEAVFRSAVWAAGLGTPDRDAAVRFVLNDGGRTLSPLFRYCAAVIYRQADLADKWRPAAESQFVRHPQAYREAWARILPAALGRIG